MVKVSSTVYPSIATLARTAFTPVILLSTIDTTGCENSSTTTFGRPAGITGFALVWSTPSVATSTKALEAAFWRPLTAVKAPAATTIDISSPGANWTMVLLSRATDSTKPSPCGCCIRKLTVLPFSVPVT